MTIGSRELAERLYAAYNRHDAQAAAELYAAGGRHEEIAQGRVVEGRDEIRGGLERLFGSFPDVRWEPRRTIADGDSTAVEYLMTGTLQAQLGPFRPAGQQLSLRGVHVVVADREEIATTLDYWDSGSFFKQMQV